MAKKKSFYPLNIEVMLKNYELKEDVIPPGPLPEDKLKIREQWEAKSLRYLSRNQRLTNETFTNIDSSVLTEMQMDNPDIEKIMDSNSSIIEQESSKTTKQSPQKQKDTKH